jgi:DNA processing protein
MSLPEERHSILGFSVFPGIGPLRVRLLQSAFGSLSAAWNATAGELKEVGLSSALVESFISFRKTFNVESYLKQLQQQSIRWLCFLDAEYPVRLQEISDPPLVLFVRGEADLSLLSMSRLIAVVGTRKMSSYGQQATEQICSELVNAGYGIVSGLALGVDGQAHKTVLNGKGKTIAVLGCGVDIIAPLSHGFLYQQICKQGGLIVSEMPVGCRPNKGTFPARNRIISGMSRGVLVIEGARTSGSLITAAYALEQGRDVFAIPGSIYSFGSAGPNFLIKNGACPVQSAQDILDVLDPGKSSSPNITKSYDFSEKEQLLIQALMSEECDVDRLTHRLPLSSVDIHTLVLSLELRAIIRRDELGIYRLTQRY